MNEATQDVAPSHASEVAEGSGRIRRRVRRSEAEAAVRPARVVVSDILVEDVLKVTPTEYERPVQALPPDSSHPTLGEGVRSRRPERGEDGPRTFGREDRIEAPGVLGVPITDEDAKWTTSSQVEGEVAGLLGDPGGVGMPRRSGGPASCGPQSRRTRRACAATPSPP